MMTRPAKISRIERRYIRHIDTDGLRFSPQSLSISGDDIDMTLRDNLTL
jgi:hypothetical protein